MAKKKDDETEEAPDEPVPHTAEALEQLNREQKASQDAYRDTGPNEPS